MCIVFLVRPGSETLIFFPFATIAESYEYQNSLQIRILILRATKVFCFIFYTSVSSILLINVIIVDCEQVLTVYTSKNFMKALHTIDVILLFLLQTLNTLVDFEHVRAVWDVNANCKKINWGLSLNFASNIK